MKDYSTFIVSELQRRGQPFQMGKDWIKVKCVSGKHADRTPSMGVKRTGEGNVPVKCLTCGFKCSWNGRSGRAGLVELLGVSPMEGKRLRVGDPEYQAEDELNAMAQEMVSLENLESASLVSVKLPRFIEPWSGDYSRTDSNGFTLKLREKVLKRVPTYRWYDTGKDGTQDPVERILWPISVDGIIYGYTGRRLDDDKFLRYNSSEHMPAPRLLFPYDYYPKLDTVVLVEGPIDALRLINAGVPAMAILGTGTWSKAKRDLLVKKGVRNVLLCFDGDKAGRAVTALVSRKLSKLFNVSYVDLPDGIDPGNMKSKTLKRIKSLLESGF